MSEKTINVRLKQSDVDKIEEIIDKTVAEFIKELPNLINRNLQQIVFKALGFSDSWGRLEVDHCNGREPFIAAYISEKAKQVCKDAISQCDFKLSDEAKKVLASEYAKKMQDLLDYNFANQAKAHFDAAMKEMLEGGEIKLEVINMQPKVKDVTDPAFGKKMPSLRDIVLKEIIKVNKDERSSD